MNFLRQIPDRGRRSTSGHHSIALSDPFPTENLSTYYYYYYYWDFVIIVVIIDGGDDDDFRCISNFWDSGRNFGVRPCKYGHTLALMKYFLSN